MHTGHFNWSKRSQTPAPLNCVDESFVCQYWCFLHNKGVFIFRSKRLLHFSADDLTGGVQSDLPFPMHTPKLCVLRSFPSDLAVSRDPISHIFLRDEINISSASLKIESVVLSPRSWLSRGQFWHKDRCRCAFCFKSYSGFHNHIDFLSSSDSWYLILAVAVVL